LRTSNFKLCFVANARRALDALRHSGITNRFDRHDPWRQMLNT